MSDTNDQEDCLDWLRTENERLRRELKEALEANKSANSAIGDIANECKKYSEQLTAAIAERDEMRKDVERLNWAIVRPYRFSKICLYESGGLETEELIRTRKAIDSAMATKTQGGGL